VSASFEFSFPHALCMAQHIICVLSRTTLRDEIFTLNPRNFIWVVWILRGGARSGALPVADNVVTRRFSSAGEREMVGGLFKAINPPRNADHRCRNTTTTVSHSGPSNGLRCIFVTRPPLIGSLMGGGMC
jgi:hypothetical protein